MEQNISQIMKRVDEQVEKELEGKYDKTAFGYIHIFEKRKKEILKDMGINWKTSDERYEGMSID